MTSSNYNIDAWSNLEKLLLCKLYSIRDIRRYKISYLLDKVMYVWFNPRKTRPKNYRTKNACESMRTKLQKEYHCPWRQSLGNAISALEDLVRQDDNGPEDLAILDTAILSERMTMLDKSDPPFWSTPEDDIELPIECYGFWNLDTDEFVLWPLEGDHGTEGLRQEEDAEAWKYAMDQLTEHPGGNE